VHIEQDYLEIFYKPNQRKLGQAELKKIYQGKYISQSESFLFGLFVAIVLASIGLIFTLIWICSISVEDDPEFKGVLPAFRGTGLIIIYCWMLAFCVYGWTEFNINYKRIFMFDHHYSTVPEVKSLIFLTKDFQESFLFFGCFVRHGYMVYHSQTGGWRYK
jgi:EXS family